MLKKGIYSLMLISLAGCHIPSLPKLPFTTGWSSWFSTPDGAPEPIFDPDSIPDAVPYPVKKSRWGNPPSYLALGKRYYVMQSAKGYDKKGKASWYGTKFHNRKTSTKERYDMYAMTAASKVLPIPCFARVTNLDNGRQIVVKVNDRGPFVDDRIMDLSYAAAAKLHMLKHGTAHVRVQAITPGESLKAPAAFEPEEIYVQAGAFADSIHAKTLQNQLQKDTDLTVIIQEKGLRQRVLLGPLYSKKEAAMLIEDLASIGYENTIISH